IARLSGPHAGRCAARRATRGMDQRGISLAASRASAEDVSLRHRCDELCAAGRRLFDSSPPPNFGWRAARNDRVRRARGRRDPGDPMVSMEGGTMIAAIATLVAGVVLGYLGQRSRMCFVGGI